MKRISVCYSPSSPYHLRLCILPSFRHLYGHCHHDSFTVDDRAPLQHRLFPRLAAVLPQPSPRIPSITNDATPLENKRFPVFNQFLTDPSLALTLRSLHQLRQSRSWRDEITRFVADVQSRFGVSQHSAPATSPPRMGIVAEDVVRKS